MLGLTTLGVLHTAIGLVALGCGVGVLVRDREITARTALGRTYLVTTLLTALTGLGIFQHGGFGPPHVLALLTLAALGGGFAASVVGLPGGWPRYLQAVCYSATILFHLIPGVTETLTRLPAGQPVFANAEAAGLRPILGGLLLAFAVGLTLQLRWLRSQRA